MTATGLVLNKMPLAEFEPALLETLVFWIECQYLSLIMRLLQREYLLVKMD